MNRKFMSVKNCLLEKINTMAPNEKLPSERDLIEEFGFSRPTIQKALSDLENEGIIYRRPRQGSFVSERRLHKSLDSLQSFPEDLRSSGDVPSTRLIAFEIIEASETVARKLGIPFITLFGCGTRMEIRSFMIILTMRHLPSRMPAVKFSSTPYTASWNKEA